MKQKDPQFSRVPIIVGEEFQKANPELAKAVDGFASVSDLVTGKTDQQSAEIKNLITDGVENGWVVWRDEWSPLYWCHTCNLPLQQQRCDICGSKSSDPIELKFTCNPRPLLPHDEDMFIAAGLPWSLEAPVVLNYYVVTGMKGWEVITDGKMVGEIVFYDSEKQFRFVANGSFDANEIPISGGGIARIVEANKTRLQAIETEAVEYIQNWCKQYKLLYPIASFSGGKDSQVMAHICHLSGIKMTVCQLDTSIDPLGNREFSQAVFENYPKMKLKQVRNKIDFIKVTNLLGPPSRDLLWCRKVLKNTMPYREKREPWFEFLKKAGRLLRYRAVIIEGPRQREEPCRMVFKREIEIPNTPVKTTCIRPILDFTDLDVWMYLHWRNIEVHETYTKGKTQRLLCHFCPDKNHLEFSELKKSNPEIWQPFEDELWRWKELLNYPDEWVTEHLWVDSEPTTEYAQNLGVTSRLEQLSARLNSCVALGEVEKKDSNYVINGEITSQFHFPSLKKRLRPLGQLKYNSKTKAVKLVTVESTVYVSAKGKIKIVSESEEIAKQTAEQVTHWLASIVNCIKCGGCTAYCSKIKITKHGIKVSARCKGEAVCDDACVADVIYNCPVNGKGIESCQYIKQNA